MLSKKGKLIVIRNPIQPTEEDVEIYYGSVENSIKSAFPHGITESVRFYHGGLGNEVFKKRETKKDVDSLLRYNGDVYAVVTPMGIDPISWVVIGVSLLVSVATMLMIPKVEVPSGSNQPPSPNNALSNRTNRPRLGGRICDIYGTLWSYPDQLMQPYVVVINDRPVEFSYMCVGKGKFDVRKAQEDSTPIEQILGSTVLVFDPDVPITGEPSFRFGNDFTAEEASYANLVAKKYTSMTDQVLSPPDNSITSSGDITFNSDGTIRTTSDNIDFTAQFNVGTFIQVTDSNDLKSFNDIKVKNADGTDSTEVVTYDLNGNYNITAVTKSVITLSSPATVAPDWQKLADNVDSAVGDKTVVSTENQTLWMGYIYLDSKDHSNAYVTIRALNGLYITYGNDWDPLKIDVEIESELVDSNGNFIEGTRYITTGSVKSPNHGKYRNSTDDMVRSTASATIFIDNPHHVLGTKLRFRIRRVTKRIRSDEGQVLQEIKLQDVYGVRNMTAADIPNGVTTVYAKTIASASAYSIKERKLRLLLQRYVRNWRDNDRFILSNRADDIMYDITVDPDLGNLSRKEIDIEQISAEVDYMISYFGTPLCSEFCYTFDDINTSVEEMLQLVARAVFSQAYRYSNMLRIYFERPVNLPIALFNSHNIMPTTFQKSGSFGESSDRDGVIIEYNDPTDDAKLSIAAGGQQNPKKEQIVGVRNGFQAYVHAWRAWNKLSKSRSSCEFVAGDESNIVVICNKVLVSDQYMTGVEQGTVLDITLEPSGYIVHTSSPVTSGDILFVQTVDGYVDSIPCVVDGDYRVRIARMPNSLVISGFDNVVTATYMLTRSDNGKKSAYIVTEKSPDSGLNNKLTCVDYREDYYANDTDFITGVYNGNAN